VIAEHADVWEVTGSFFGEPDNAADESFFEADLLPFDDSTGDEAVLSRPAA